MAETVDTRGFSCPVPVALAARALAGLDAGAELVVLADDPEAAIDLAALAHDRGRTLRAEPAADGATRYRLAGCPG